MTAISLRPIGWAALSASLTACAGADAPLVERADSAGVEIVTHTGPDRPLAWTFSEVFSLGGEETEEESFYQIGVTAIGVDAAGNVYVLDTSAKRVVVFDVEGAFLRSMGGEGGGPGEMNFPLALVVSPDGIASVFDIAKIGFVRFGPDGEILEELRTTFQYRGGLMRHVGGTLVAPVGDFDSERGVSTNGLIAISGEDTARITVLEGPASGVVTLESCGMQIGGLAPVFWPRLRWSPAGTSVAVALGASYAIAVYENAAAVRSIRRRVEPTPANEEAALAAVGENMRVMTPGGVRVCDAAEVVEQRGVADVVPAIAELAEGPDGTLWVRRSTGPGGPRPIDVFGADGIYLGTLPDDAPFPVAVMGSRIAAIETDEMDVERLVVYEVER
jgi:hypothetical protein